MFDSVSANTTRPVERTRVAEMQQPIQTSNLIRWIEFDKAEIRRMNQA